MILTVLLLFILALVSLFGVYLVIYLRPTRRASQNVQQKSNLSTEEVVEVSEEEKAKNKIENVSKKDIAKLAIFLAVLGIICSGLLALVNSITSPIIEKQKQAELEKTLEVIKVKNPVTLTDVELVDGVDVIYSGTVEGVECYVFQTTIKNSYKTITTLFVVSKSDKKIIEVAPTVGDGLSTHNMDSALLESNFGLIGSSSSDYKANFVPVAGASRSSDSIIWGADKVFEQLGKMEG